MAKASTVHKLPRTLGLPASMKPLGKPIYSSLVLRNSVKPVSQAERVTRRQFLRYEVGDDVPQGEGGCPLGATRSQLGVKVESAVTEEKETVCFCQSRICFQEGGFGGGGFREDFALAKCFSPHLPHRGPLRSLFINLGRGFERRRGCRNGSLFCSHSVE